MKNIEIIVVNDNSNDNSLKLIQNVMKNDKRIRLIDNKENRRILFCKSIGALNSKGKYIIELDQDDMFLNDEAFDIIYKLSENYDLDMLHFNSISSNNIFQLSLRNKLKIFLNKIKINTNIIDKQPNIKLNIFRKHICVLWGNLIKSDLYKKVIYNLWPIIINYKIIFQEDFLITFFILIYAQRYKNIKDILYLYYNNIESISNEHKNNSEYYLSVIFAGIIFFDYYIDYYSQDIEIIINYIYFLKEDFKKSKCFYPDLFHFFFGKILSNEHLLQQYKQDIANYFNISVNCDSYIYLNSSDYLIMNEFLFKKVEIHTSQNQIIKLSIIIISNNYEKIIRIIKEINKQNFDNLELILLYDDISKENYNLLYNYTKSHSFIKLIKNKMEKGIANSISKGIMISKGKYIMILNPNCFFLNNKFFQQIYQEIEKEDADILEFNLYKVLPNNFADLYKCKHFTSRFNLSQIKYNTNFNEIDIKKELLTNKLFQAFYLKNMIKKFYLNNINEIIDYYYNDIFNFIIENTSHKFKYISSINIYINDTDVDKFKFNDFTIENQNMIREAIYYINFIFDNSKNTYESKEKVVQEFFSVLSLIFNKFTKVSESSFRLLNKFLNCKYISQSNKDLLKFYVNSLLN